MSDEFDEDIEALINGGLAGDFDPLDRDAAASAIGAHVVNWRLLDDDQAHAEWSALREWVEWFVERYNVAVSLIPNCWWKHGPLVEELSALHTAHVAAFDPSDSGFGPIGWHERLTIAIPRLQKAYTGTCRAEHVDQKSRTLHGATDEKAWLAWTAQSHGQSH